MTEKLSAPQRAALEALGTDRLTAAQVAQRVGFVEAALPEMGAVNALEALVRKEKVRRFKERRPGVARRYEAINR